VAVASTIHPVLVTVVPPDAAETLVRLLGDYGAVLASVDDDSSTVAITPVDDERRSVVLYRVIQASRTVVQRHPDSTLYLLTEEGSRWRLPPPAL
jgi:hypothetical protein